ncbi:hypothetical protein M413DRAFT_351015 [Hebeloma cylindrosporum]|uniref:Uncharacterized protein n=1 Tax=Hebeloma cylindrosporum TaxID=76867 RepID=A0A0C2Y2H4_HEBCY|nr:hypothetical protein M413DRAFT_351015 [Hebeloma cylindrosporum h7]
MERSADSGTVVDNAVTVGSASQRSARRERGSRVAFISHHRRAKGGDTGIGRAVHAQKGRHSCFRYFSMMGEERE